MASFLSKLFGLNKDAGFNQDQAGAAPSTNKNPPKPPVAANLGLDSTGDDQTESVQKEAPDGYLLGHASGIARKARVAGAPAKGEGLYMREEDLSRGLWMSVGVGGGSNRHAATHSILSEALKKRAAGRELGIIVFGDDVADAASAAASALGMGADVHDLRGGLGAESLDLLGGLGPDEAAELIYSAAITERNAAVENMMPEFREALAHFCTLAHATRDDELLADMGCTSMSLHFIFQLIDWTIRGAPKLDALLGRLEKNAGDGADVDEKLGSAIKVVRSIAAHEIDEDVSMGLIAMFVLFFKPLSVDPVIQSWTRGLKNGGVVEQLVGKIVLISTDFTQGPGDRIVAALLKARLIRRAKMPAPMPPALWLLADAKLFNIQPPHYFFKDVESRLHPNAVGDVQINLFNDSALLLAAQTRHSALQIVYAAHAGELRGEGDKRAVEFIEGLGALVATSHCDWRWLFDLPNGLGLDSETWQHIYPMKHALARLRRPDGGFTSDWIDGRFERCPDSADHDEIVVHGPAESGGQPYTLSKAAAKAHLGDRFTNAAWRELAKSQAGRWLKANSEKAALEATVLANGHQVMRSKTQSL